VEATNVIRAVFTDEFFDKAYGVIKSEATPFNGVFALRRVMAEPPLSFCNTFINVTIKRLRKRGLVK
jgi:hypothetical protein